jgi:hypothetical protein
LLTDNRPSMLAYRFEDRTITATTSRSIMMCGSIWHHLPDMRSRNQGSNPSRPPSGNNPEASAEMLTCQIGKDLCTLCNIICILKTVRYAPRAWAGCSGAFPVCLRKKTGGPLAYVADRGAPRVHRPQNKKLGRTLPPCLARIPSGIHPFAESALWDAHPVRSRGSQAAISARVVSMAVQPQWIQNPPLQAGVL